MKNDTSAASQSPKETKEERLQAALRANLKRRKAPAQTQKASNTREQTS